MVLLLALLLGPDSVNSAYFVAVAQVTPLLMIALAIDLGYFRNPLPPVAWFFILLGRNSRWWTPLLFALYPLSTFFLLAIAESAALWALTSTAGGSIEFALCAAGLSAGASALFFAISFHSISLRNAK